MYFKRLLYALFGKSLETATNSKVHKIEYYDSAETYPYKRSQRFYKFLAKGAETGDSPIDFFKRIDLAMAYFKDDMKEKGFVELSNLRMVWFHTINEYSPVGAAQAISVKSIDGVMCNDITTDGLDATLQKLSDMGLTVEDIENQVETIKKKSKMSWLFTTKIRSTDKMQSTMQH